MTWQAERVETRLVITAMSSLFLQRLASPSRTISSHRSPVLLARSSKWNIARNTSILRSYSTNTESSPSSPSSAEASGIQGESGSALPHVVSADGATDWSRSYHGLSEKPFPTEVAEILMAPLDPADVEVKPGELNELESLTEH